MADRFYFSLIHPASINAVVAAMTYRSKPVGVATPAQRYDHVVALAGCILSENDENGVVIDVEHFVCLAPGAAKAATYSVPADQVRPVAILKANVGAFQAIDADGNPTRFDAADFDLAPSRFRYRNHAGQVADRIAAIKGLRYGTDDYHKEPGWLLDAYDYERHAVRTFAVSGLIAPDSGE